MVQKVQRISTIQLNTPEVSSRELVLLEEQLADQVQLV